MDKTLEVQKKEMIKQLKLELELLFDRVKQLELKKKQK
jgi:hypothetical protein